MKQARVARQVETTTNEIFSVQEELRTLAEQLAVWSDMRDDLHMRSVVSETPQAGADLAGVERQLRIAVEAVEAKRLRLGELERLLELLMSEWEPEVVL